MGHFLTKPVMTDPFSIGDAASARRFDYFTLKDFNCPIILFDHVRMSRSGFPPHPHAGFSVFTYLFRDSQGSLLSRDSLNEEIVVQPGDLLWFRMASGMIHEENPLVAGPEVHQLQAFVNLAPAHQSLPPKTFHLKAGDVPEITGAGGAPVRVVVGSHGGKTSPLVPPETFTFLDVDLSAEFAIDVPLGWSGLVYLVAGRTEARVGEEMQPLATGEALGVREGAALRLAAREGSRAVFLARPLLEQPIVMQGMYVMTKQDDIDAAKRRFHAGQFGEVVPYPKVVNPSAPYVPAGQDPNLTVSATVERQATVRHYDEGWWKLHLQYCLFSYSDGETAQGYRFAWENPDGREAPYREAGYLPYMEYLTELLAIAAREGWGDIPYRDSF